MFRIKQSVHVLAPVERCFLLSTSVPLVQRILGLKPVAGRTTGLVQMGDRVLWRGWKFGLPVKHETLITEYQFPSHFQDAMASGQFRVFRHDHRFEEVAGHTLMVDVVEFSLPFWLLGRWVGRRIVAPHVLRLLDRRFALLKRIAEGSDWERYLGDATRPAGGAGIGVTDLASNPE